MVMYTDVLVIMVNTQILAPHHATKDADAARPFARLADQLVSSQDR